MKKACQILIKNTIGIDRIMQDLSFKVYFNS